MREIISAFETKHDQILVQLSDLRIGSEEIALIAGAASAADFEPGLEYQGDKSLTRSLSQGNLISHAKLQRRSSVGPLTLEKTLCYARRGSLGYLRPSSTKLPKIALRRLSSDITGSGRDFVQIQETLSRFNDAQQIYKPEHKVSSGHVPLKRKSFPQEQDKSLGFQREQEPHGRRRRARTWCSTTRQPRPSSCQEVSQWRMRLHKRTLNLDDDDDDDDDDDVEYLENDMCGSSSSSGFSSLSSVF